MYKVNKFTVSTRITGDLKKTLEREAQENGVSFCFYLEQIIINRLSPTVASDDLSVLKEDFRLIQTERDSLLEQVEDLKEVIVSLEEDLAEDVEFDDLDDPERQELLDRIQELESKVVELEELNELLQTLEEEAEDYEEDDLRTLLDDVETAKSELESKNQELVARVELLQGELSQQKDHLLESDALIYLQKKHTDLSKDEIIKIALDCTATNDGRSWRQTMYSFTDYLKRAKSFIHLQTNKS